jgi:glutaredoxin-dependent peroxiredoxin
MGEGETKMPLQKGEKAPDFTVYNTDKKAVSLHDILGKKSVLVFFPGAFTGICTKEMCTFRDQLVKFNELGGQVYGISVDGPSANDGFAKHNNLNFPLLSDFTREVSRKYGGVHEDFWGIKGYAAAKRAVYVLNENGTVIYSWITDNPGMEPNYEEVQASLQQS